MVAMTGGGELLDLFKAADHRTAMGNAVPELKELADFISTENTNHGIINAFKSLGHHVKSNKITDRKSVSNFFYLFSRTSRLR